MIKRRRRRKTTAKNRINNNILFLISIFIIAQLIFLTSSFFQVKAVDITGEGEVTQSQIFQSLQPLIGKNVFLLKMSDIKDQFKNVFWVKDISISYAFPGKLKIKINNKKPQACVRGGGNDKNAWYEISSEGEVLRPSANPGNLLKITVEEPVTEQFKLDKAKLNDAQDIYKKLPDPYREKLDYISINSLKEYSLNGKFLSSGVEIKLGVAQNLEYKMNVLCHILNKAAELNKKISYIDLRYDQPVINVSGKQ